MLYGPHYNPTLEYNKFQYTAGITVPNSINRPTIHPIPYHNLSLPVLFQTSRHHYKASQGKREHNKYYPCYTPTQEYNKFHYTAGLTFPNSITRPTIHPMSDHNLALLVAFHPSRHG